MVVPFGHGSRVRDRFEEEVVAGSATIKRKQARDGD
jgi:hypothetical protein